jgi:hypothetical protein
MKAYFLFTNDLFQNGFFGGLTALRLKSYKIDNVETLTNDFLTDTQSILSMPITDFDYCQADEFGVNITPNTDPAQANSFNPFAKSFLLDYPLISGMARGLPTGTTTGRDYGSGVLNFGVDKPIVKAGEGLMVEGDPFEIAPYFLEIDFSKSLYIEFDLVNTILTEGSPYEQPYVIQTYVIKWDKAKCKKEYYIIDQRATNPDGQPGVLFDITYLGFLSGVTKTNFEDDPFLNIECGIDSSSCDIQERSRSFAMFVNIPQEQEDPDAVFKECCYHHYIFADVNTTEDFRNDYSGFYHQRQLSNETCDFVLLHMETNTEYDLDDNTFGQFFDFGFFPTNPMMKGFLVQWKKVLTDIGEGNFKVIKRQTIVGLNFSFPSITFTLRQFSSMMADKTTRIDVVMNGRLENGNLDFTGLNWKHSMRVPGFFGRREPSLEEDNIVNRNFEKRQISMKQANEYKFQTNLIPDCLTNEIFDFMIYANDIFLNDYNLNNHSYKFRKFGVKFASNEGTGYLTTSRKARLNLTFNDKFDNNLKRNFK